MIKNKGKKGAALGLTVILVFIFTLIGMAVMLGSAINLQQARITHDIDAAFFASESYLQYVVSNMTVPLQTEFQQQIEEHIDNLDTGIFAPDATISLAGFPVGDAGDALYEHLNNTTYFIDGILNFVNSFNIQQLFMDVYDNYVHHSHEDFNAKYMTADSIELHPITYDDIDISAKGNNVFIEINPTITLTSISYAGTQTSVELVLSFEATFVASASGGGGGAGGGAGSDDINIVTYSPPPNAGPSCVGECYHGLHGIYWTCVRDQDDLQNITRDGDYILAEDIELTGYFEPIGNPVVNAVNYFHGNFNGNGRTISGLQIDVTGRAGGVEHNYGVGLFGRVANATIENFVLELGGDIVGVAVVGAIVGTTVNSGGAGAFAPQSGIPVPLTYGTAGNVTIRNIHVIGNGYRIEATGGAGTGDAPAAPIPNIFSYVGGAVGFLGPRGSIIEYIIVEDLNIIAGGNCAGGLVGAAYPAGNTISNILINKVNITGEGNASYLGGLAGRISWNAGVFQFGNNTSTAPSIISDVYIMNTEINNGIGGSGSNNNIGGAFGHLDFPTSAVANIGWVPVAAIRISNVITRANIVLHNTASNTAGNIGGFAGYIRDGWNANVNWAAATPTRGIRIINSATYSNIQAPWSTGNVGGFAGHIVAETNLFANNSIRIENSYARNNINVGNVANNTAAGFVGRITSSTGAGQHPTGLFHNTFSAGTLDVGGGVTGGSFIGLVFPSSVFANINSVLTGSNFVCNNPNPLPPDPHDYFAPGFGNTGISSPLQDMPSYNYGVASDYDNFNDAASFPGWYFGAGGWNVPAPYNPYPHFDPWVDIAADSPDSLELVGMSASARFIKMQNLRETTPN